MGVNPYVNPQPKILNNPSTIINSDIMTTNNPEPTTPPGVEYMIVSEFVRLGEKVKVPLFNGIKPVMVNFPCMIVKGSRSGSPLDQHNRILSGLPDFLVSTYNITASETERYHYFNIKGTGRANNMREHYLTLTTEARKHNPIPWLNESNANKEYQEKIKGKSRPDIPVVTRDGKTIDVTDEKIYGESMTKTTDDKIPVTCHKCNHVTMVNRTVKRARCGGKVNGKTCMTDISKSFKSLLGQPVTPSKPQGRPKKVTPESPVTSPDTPQGPPVAIPEENVIEVTPPPVQPSQGVVEQIPKPQPVPETVQPPQVTPITPPNPDAFSIEELKVLCSPLHTMEAKMVNHQMPNTIDEPMIEAMNKSLAVILDKVQQMFPDKAFLIAIATYMSTQGIILGSLWLNKQEQTKKEQAEVTRNQNKTQTKATTKGKGK